MHRVQFIFTVEITRWQALTASVTKFFRLLERDLRAAFPFEYEKPIVLSIHKSIEINEPRWEPRYRNQGIVNHVGANRFPVLYSFDLMILIFYMIAAYVALFLFFLYFFFAYISFSRARRSKIFIALNRKRSCVLPIESIKN